LAQSVVVVAGPGWDRGPEVRQSLPASFEIEVVPYGSISTPAREWGQDLGAVFVDNPSIGPSTVEVVIELQRLVDASIIVLGEDADPTDIVGAIMAGADLYVRRDLLTNLVLRWSNALTREGRSAKEIVRNYAEDAIQTAARVPAIHRTGALSDVLLKSVTDDVTTRRPLLHRARASFERQLLNEFASVGVGSAPAVADDEPQEAVAAPPQLFWNTRFPDDEGILRNKPHLVVAQAEYLLETALGPTPEPGAQTSPVDLVEKEIAFRLEATNGEFRLLDSSEWRVRVVSSPTPCWASGTDPFRVYYRARSAGQATIEAFLLVDNGSVDQQRIGLTIVDPDATAIEATSFTEDPVPSGRSARPAVESAAGPDYTFRLHWELADLMHGGNLILATEKVPRELGERMNDFARSQYEQLREISSLSHLAGDPKRPLRLKDTDEAVLRLAQIGARLHHALFTSPIPPIDGGLPDEMRKIAERLRGVETTAGPPLLQILAPRFPLPWGLLYDRSPGGGDDLKSVDDVDPFGFWGRRFDIYRSVLAVDVAPHRGVRRWVKPVVGTSVPRGAEQQRFLDRLRSEAADNLVVQDTSSTPSEFETWVRNGDESDLLYFFCHAKPDRLDTKGTVLPGALGFGAEETESRAGLDELRDWWPDARAINPIVFLNACSSGQQDLIHGAPFVDLFLGHWKAQAFVGTDWPVNAGFADAFGQRVLLKLLKERVSLRTALRTVSDEAAADRNYFPLMYAVYGLNSVRFIDPARAA
jgi:DNA-binding NarL/FixJ family response regulator